MSILENHQIEKFIKYTEEQLDNERILYESRIIDDVAKIAEEKGIELRELKFEIYAQQWMLLNIPPLQSEKSAMQRHHEEVMTEKFAYYNRTHNFDGLNVWVESVLKNIGFTEYEADRILKNIYKIGAKLYKRTKTET